MQSNIEWQKSEKNHSFHRQELPSQLVKIPGLQDWHTCQLSHICKPHLQLKPLEPYTPWPLSCLFFVQAALSCLFFLFLATLVFYFSFKNASHLHVVSVVKVDEPHEKDVPQKNEKAEKG